MPVMPDPDDIRPPPAPSGAPSASRQQPRLNTLIKKRSVVKRKITSTINHVDRLDQNNVEVSCNVIDKYMNEIEAIDKEICDEFSISEHYELSCQKEDMVVFSHVMSEMNCALFCGRFNCHGIKYDTGEMILIRSCERN